MAQLGKHKYPDRPMNLFGIEPAEEEMNTPEKKQERVDGFRAFAFVWNLEHRKKMEREVKDDA